MAYAQKWINGKALYVHRLVWEEAHGPIPPGMLVDHINGDTRDNRITNLRLASPAQNSHNAGARSDNRTGLKGLTWYPSLRKWRAYVTYHGKQRSRLGSDLFEVCCWLFSTRKALHGDFARF